MFYFSTKKTKYLSNNKTSLLRYSYLETFKHSFNSCSGAVNDVLRRLDIMFPGEMKEFRTKLCLKYERSGMPSGLNGPQIDKVFRNLDLLAVMLGTGAIPEGCVEYLHKLKNLYSMCVRYFIFQLYEDFSEQFFIF